MHSVHSQKHWRIAGVRRCSSTQSPHYTFQVTMGSRIAFLFLALAISCISSNARSLITSEVAEFVIPSERKAAAAAVSSIRVSDGSCLLCKTALAPMIAQLNDPATRFLLKQILLSNCDKFTSEGEDCETVVDEYINALIDNAKDYLQDICTALHFCSTRSETMVGSAAATA